MVVDMSHSSEKSTLQAIEISERPIVISHANPSFWHPLKEINLIIFYQTAESKEF